MAFCEGVRILASRHRYVSKLMDSQSLASFVIALILLDEGSPGEIIHLPRVLALDHIGERYYSQRQQ